MCDAKVKNVRIEKIQALVEPHEILEKHKMTEQESNFISETRKSISQIISGQSNRLLLIIGPCSIHHHDSAIEYAKRLSFYCQKYKDKMEVVMRVYFEKPRTTVGWKGYVYDPYLDNSCKINDGLEKARQLMKIITQLGVPIACEFLDTITPQFFSDYVSWGAIGARTTESQTHRQLASGLSMPIGFKNGTDGSVKIAAEAMVAASSQHTFCGVDENGKCAIVHTSGNPYSHIILRGANNSPNYYLQDVEKAVSILANTCKTYNADFHLGVMIDCSHDNSGKNYKMQRHVVEYIIQMKKESDIFAKSLLGVMIESNLVEGKQVICENMTFGQSVTDGCIGWEETVELLDKIYNNL